jgi:GTP cyclohydrolase I
MKAKEKNKKKSKIVKAVKEIIEVYDNAKRESIIETPERVYKFYEEFFAKKDNLKIKTFKNPGYNELIIESGIRFYSLCEHHLLPFFGYVYIGYLPSKEIIGLSKLSRIVDYFASQFTIQERLTNEIADFLWQKLSADWVGVLIKARHLCKEMRGVEKDSVMTTLAIKGRYYKELYFKNLFLMQVLSDNRSI